MPMKKNQLIRFNLFLALILLTTNILAQTQNFVWGQRYGQSENDEAIDMATSENGTSYLIGEFKSDTFIIGNYTLTANASINYFIAKFSNDGNVIWAKNLTALYDIYPNAICLDAEENYTITGSFGLDSLLLGNDLLIGGNGPMFVAKFDSSGAPIWGSSLDGNGADVGFNVTTFNNITYVIGGYRSSVLTTATATFYNSINTNYYDIFLIKYDNNGNEVWAKSFNGAGQDKGLGITTDSNGNVLITGQFYSPNLSFGDDTLYNTSGSLNYADVFIAKISSDGNILWKKNGKGQYDDIANSIKTDNNQNIYVTGSFYGQNFIFDNDTMVNNGFIGTDLFLVKFDANGTVLWARSDGFMGFDEGWDICLDAMGNSFITGKLGTPDPFIRGYDMNGNELWTKYAYGSADSYSIGIDLSGNLYTAGRMTNDMNFGSFTLTSAGSGDVYISKLNYTTGVSEINYTKESPFFFPNPASNEIIIDKLSPVATAVSITNTIGQIVKTLKVNHSNPITINIADLADGTYIIRIDDGFMHTSQLLVKKH